VTRALRIAVLALIALSPAARGPLQLAEAYVERQLPPRDCD
jgi:hypothetical protein